MPSNGELDWNEMDFLIKWKGQSYMHCQWKSLFDLQHLNGFKKVLNYTRKVEEEQNLRRELSREEAEVHDVSKEMELELLTQYRQVERVFADRTTKIDSDNEVQEYLVKWKGLSFAEATWTVVEANQVLSADLAQATSSADIEIENGMGSLLSTINDSLKMDHEAYQNIQPTLNLSTDAIVELQTSHCSKVADITEKANKYLHEEYMEDHSNCTNQRGNLSVSQVLNAFNFYQLLALKSYCKDFGIQNLKSDQNMEMER